MKPLLLFQAPVLTRSGYGDHARDILRSLVKMNRFDIRVWNTRWGDTAFIDIDNSRDIFIKPLLLETPQVPKKPDVYIQVTIPQEFQPVGNYNIGITAGIETTHCSLEWVAGNNRMDLVIVPSEHAKTVFDNSIYSRIDDQTKQVLETIKTTKPVEVLFEGVDTDVFYQTDSLSDVALRKELNSLPSDFCFLFVGHWLRGDMFHDRKDVGGLIKVFLETFKDQPHAPSLILKTSMATMSVMDRNEVLKRIAQIKSTIAYKKSIPSVYLLHGELTQSEMNTLYNHPKVKAHVTFTKGEGFGRPLLEASLSGKPVIAPGWSGHIDFLKPEYSVLLPGELTKVHPSSVWDTIIIADSSWFTVNYQVASKAMFDVWTRYVEYKVRAGLQAEHSKNFTLNKMHEKFVEILDAHLPKFAEEVPLQLPDFSKLELPKLQPIANIPLQTVEEPIDSVNAEPNALPNQAQEKETFNETPNTTI